MGYRDGVRSTFVRFISILGPMGWAGTPHGSKQQASCSMQASKWQRNAELNERVLQATPATSRMALV